MAPGRKSDKKEDAGDELVTRCPVCKTLASVDSNCDCGMTSINAAGQVFGFMHGTDYRESRPSAVVRTRAEEEDAEKADQEFAETAEIVGPVTENSSSDPPQ